MDFISEMDRVRELPVTSSTKFYNFPVLVRRTRLVAGCFFLLSMSGYALAAELPTPAQAAVRDSAVRAARQGDVRSAYQQLDNLYQKGAQLRGLSFDLAVVASWAGDDSRAAEVLADHDLEEIPTYVLLPYAKSLRNLKRWDQAVTVYERLLSQSQTEQAAELHFEALIGVVLTLADAGRPQAARNHLAVVEPDTLQTEQQTQFYFACGYIDERQSNFIQALDCYNLGLRLDPDNRNLLRRRVVVASALGATQFAQAELSNLPELVAHEERAQIELDTDAMHIRWTGLEEGRARIQSVNDVLSERERFNFLASPLTPRQASTKVYDEIVAHVGIGEMPGALSLADGLFAKGVRLDALPAYVAEALGYAYMYMERPERAIRCFKAALAKTPVTGGERGGEEAAKKQRFKTSVGLFYALSDAGRFEEVAILVAELRAMEVPWERPTEKIWLQNPRYTDSVHLSALALAYRERYAEALVQLENMLAIAPANNYLRLSRAAVTRWRGWPRQASRELARLPRDDRLPGKWVQLTHIGLETQNYPAAEHSIAYAQSLEPRDKAVLDVARRWRQHNKPMWEMNVSTGRSDGAQVGNESLQASAIVYTAPIRHNFRAYLKGTHSYAEFTEGVGRDSRGGVGVEYRNQAWTAAGEVHKGFEQYDGVGASFRVSYQPNDFWRHAVDAGIDSNETPLRGLRQGVEGDLIRYQVGYRWHESRSANLSIAAMDFSDGNQRQWVDLRFRQRVGNWPRHKLAVLGGVYASRNDSDSVAYFSPRKDRDVGVDLEHEWRPWVRYDRAFIQRITVGLGQYHQENFSSKGRWSATLEHEWRLTDGFSVIYGASFARRPYDGIQERQRSFFLTLRGYL